MDNEQKLVDRFDWTLSFILFLFFIISIAAITSAQVGEPLNYASRQILFYAVGIVIIAVAMYFDPDQYRKLSWVFYGLGILMLVLLLVAPDSMLAKKDIKSWFKIPVIGTIQPSEFMKTFLILLLSKFIVDHNEKTKVKMIKTDFILVGKLFLITAIPLGLVLLQPDLGTALVFIAIFAGMVLVSGISWKIIIPTIGTIGLIGTTALLLVLYKPEFLAEKFGIEKYQFDRIYTWVDPYNYPTDEGYNLIQVLKAIGSGEITGKGFMEKVVHVPEQHTDFIYSVIGEEYGFIGASLVIILFFLLIYHIIKISLLVKDPFCSYVCAGIICMITFHVLENIGMQLQLLPITGIPLPFISSGGSSLMGNMLAMGLIFSMRFHHKTYMFETEEDEG